MKAVLISIQPNPCEFIASGKKTVEVRKTKPKIETPFKCYIYCTKSEKNLIKGDISTTINFIAVNGGKVIGEFVCDKIFTIRYRCGSYRCEGMTVLENDRVASASQLSLYDMRNYLSCNGGYAWHISDLVIYDKPKELREFKRACPDNVRSCAMRRHSGYTPMKCLKTITRPPQSWCYVEELKGE